MKKKRKELIESVQVFSVDFNAIDTSEILCLELLKKYLLYY